MSELIHTTDWLGSNTLFFNYKTGAVSENIQEVVDLNDIQPDFQGLYNYLNYGYSMFGRTVYKDIKYMQHSSELRKRDDGSLYEVQLPDPILPFLNNSESSVMQVINVFEKNLNKSLSEFDLQNMHVVLPLSGGLDSRLLGYFLRNMSNISAFTYGVSRIQEKSSEVKFAQEIASSLEIDWNFIKLTHFHDYFEANFDLYGPSMHAHSMYHFEFYSKIACLLPQHKQGLVVSGAYGDLWAGNWNFDYPQTTDELKLLGITHGIHDQKTASWLQRCLGGSLTSDEDEFLEGHRHLLRNPIYRIVTAARFKMMLIRHLFQTPKRVGFDVISPFLDINVAMAMMKLPASLRDDRKWQRDFLDNRLLGVEGVKNFSRRNDLEFFQTKSHPLSSISGVNLESESVKFVIECAELNLSIFDVAKYFLRKNGLSDRVASKLKLDEARFQKRYNSYVLKQPLATAFSRRN